MTLDDLLPDPRFQARLRKITPMAAHKFERLIQDRAVRMELIKLFGGRKDVVEDLYPRTQKQRGKADVR